MFRRISPQVSIFPCNDKYSEKEVASLKKSWGQVIKDKMLPYFQGIEGEFARFFSANMGRPIKYISVLILLQIYKEVNNWTDTEAIDAIYFDKRFEFAFELSFEDIIVCQKTLHNFRHLILKHEIARKIFKKATDHIIKVLNTDTSEQRIDSSHVTSNMAKLSRLELFVRVTENFLRKLKQTDPAAYEQLPSRFEERYGKRRGYFADARSKKVRRRLGECANDIWYLIDHFRGEEKIAALKVMGLLKRVFDEHCSIEKTQEETTVTVDAPEDKPVTTAESQREKAEAPELSNANSQEPSPQPAVESSNQKAPDINPVSIKHPKEIPSNALQNPSDEDAAYGYKGQGYEATLTETCSSKNAVQIITDVQVDPANHSDQNTTIPAVDRLAANDNKPEVLYGDGNFVSGENILECAKRDVDLQGNLPGNDAHPEKLKLADFEFAGDGTTVKACPEGQEPSDQRPQHVHKPDPGKPDRRFLVHFDRQQCEGCPLLENCPVTLQKKNAGLTFSQSELASSQRRREQETHAFKERNNIRAGIESTNAEMKTKHGMGRLRVRGRPRVEMALLFKALACNVKRMVTYVQSLPQTAPEPQKAAPNTTDLAFC